MREHIVTGLMLVVAAIHLLPVSGFFGASRLFALYGLDVESPDLEVLMRHRAALFGILGAFFAYAAFVPQVQPIAMAAAAASLAAFFYLAVAVEGYSSSIRRVVRADIIAAVCLAAAVLVRAFDSGTH